MGIPKLVHIMPTSCIFARCSPLLDRQAELSLYISIVTVNRAVGAEIRLETVNKYTNE